MQLTETSESGEARPTARLFRFLLLALLAVAVTAVVHVIRAGLASLAARTEVRLQFQVETPVPVASSASTEGVQCRWVSPGVVECAGHARPESDTGDLVAAIKAHALASYAVRQVSPGHFEYDFAIRTVAWGTGTELQAFVQLLYALLVALSLIATFRLGKALPPSQYSPGESALGWAVLALPIAIVVPVFLYVLSLTGMPAPISATAVAVILLGAVTEEVFFRWWLIGRLGLQLGSTASVLLSSVLFMLAHGDFSVRSSLLSLFFGLCLGFGYLRTRMLLVCIAVHFAFNLFLALGGRLAPS